MMGLGLVLCLVPLASLLLTLVVKGSQALSIQFLFSGWQPVGESHGGIAHAIVGSICLLAVASALAAPLGLAQGLFLARGRNPRLMVSSRLLLDMMSGIPAIIIGVFVYTLVVSRSGFSLGTGFSMVAGGLSLAMIMLPIVARTTEGAVRSIPSHVDEAGLALGLPRRRVIMRIVLRSAIPGVLTGMFLALSRVAGEAAPLLFTAFGSNALPTSPLEPTGSLPQLLFDYARQPFEELVQQAWGAALVLVAMILVIRLLSNAYAGWRYGRESHA
jgi:phosphate transport system permease protein